jgi:LysM repeat protein
MTGKQASSRTLLALKLMKSNILLLVTAATVALASCSQEKQTETTETTAVPSGTTETTTTTTTVDTASYRTSASQLADQVAADLRATDAATKARLQQIYYNRARSLGDLDARPDTVGRYAAVRDLNDMTTREVRTVVTDPAAYGTYTANQGNYYAGPYTAAATTTTTTTTTATPARRSLGARVGQGSGIKKLENDKGDHKVKYENGAKIKRSDDGSVKIKRADGTKIKIDEDGHRTVKKGLF